MKIKSELYIQELGAILHGLNLQAEDCLKTLKRERRKAQIAVFLTPWLSREIWTALAVNADILTKRMNTLSELREKIMQAEGVDDDMKCITFQQMCEKAQQD